GANQGSEFVVRLPLLADEDRGSRIEDRGSPLRDPRSSILDPRMRRRVLVVDDSVDVAATLARYLELTGHEVRVAHDGPAALAAAQAQQPEVVLLDIGLPRMDGYEVARRLRQQPTLANVLLVALTGYGQEEDRHRSREAGFDHHLVKPVDPAALQGLLAALAAPAGQGAAAP